MTMYPAFFRPRVALSTRRERFVLPDDDFVDLDWVGDPPGSPRPTVLLLHGLEGSIESPYARGLLSEIQRHGWRGVLMHFRGCSGEPNRRPRAYHSGETTDVAAVIAALRQRLDRSPLAAVGYSLGGNVLLKYLGEAGAEAGLSAAAAVSVPMMLSPCAHRLQRGFSRVYDRYLLDSLKRSFARKRSAVDLGPVGQVEPGAIGSIWSFDENVTAPLHGFEGAEDYYAQSSSRPFLRGIEVPTLILQAKDDPFMTPDVIPEESELAPSVTLELSEHGGHVAFVSGSPWRPKFWLEQRIPEFLAPHLRIESRATNA